MNSSSEGVTLSNCFWPDAERHTNVAGDVRVKTAKDNVTVLELIRLALPHHHLGDVAHGGGLLPPHGILILLARGAGRGADGVEGEVRMLGEEEDEALTDGASGTEDT
jgi:hypothetical protein